MLKRGLPPVHPGEILREDYIRERGLTVTQIAKGLGIARENLSAIVNGIRLIGFLVMLIVWAITKRSG